VADFAQAAVGLAIGYEQVVDGLRCYGHWVFPFEVFAGSGYDVKFHSTRQDQPSFHRLSWRKPSPFSVTLPKLSSSCPLTGESLVSHIKDASVAACRAASCGSDPSLPVRERAYQCGCIGGCYTLTKPVTSRDGDSSDKQGEAVSVQDSS
jgi:hypothetical protein